MRPTLNRIHSARMYPVSCLIISCFDLCCPYGVCVCVCCRFPMICLLVSGLHNQSRTGLRRGLSRIAARTRLPRENGALGYRVVETVRTTCGSRTLPFPPPLPSPPFDTLEVDHGRRIGTRRRHWSSCDNCFKSSWISVMTGSCSPMNYWTTRIDCWTRKNQRVIWICTWY